MHLEVQRHPLDDRAAVGRKSAAGRRYSEGGAGPATAPAPFPRVRQQTGQQLVALVVWVVTFPPPRAIRPVHAPPPYRVSSNQAASVSLLRLALLQAFSGVEGPVRLDIFF